MQAQRIHFPDQHPAQAPSCYKRAACMKPTGKALLVAGLVGFATTAYFTRHLRGTHAYIIGTIKRWAAGSTILTFTGLYLNCKSYMSDPSYRLAQCHFAASEIQDHDLTFAEIEDRYGHLLAADQQLWSDFLNDYLNFDNFDFETFRATHGDGVFAYFNAEHLQLARRGFCDHHLKLPATPLAQIRSDAAYAPLQITSENLKNGLLYHAATAQIGIEQAKAAYPYYQDLGITNEELTRLLVDADAIAALEGRSTCAWFVGKHGADALERVVEIVSEQRPHQFHTAKAWVLHYCSFPKVRQMQERHPFLGIQDFDITARLNDWPHEKSLEEFLAFHGPEAGPFLTERARYEIESLNWIRANIETLDQNAQDLPMIKAGIYPPYVGQAIAQFLDAYAHHCSEADQATAQARQNQQALLLRAQGPVRLAKEKFERADQALAKAERQRQGQARQLQRVETQLQECRDLANGLAAPTADVASLEGQVSQAEQALRQAGLQDRDHKRYQRQREAIEAKQQELQKLASHDNLDRLIRETEVKIGSNVTDESHKGLGEARAAARTQGRFEEYLRNLKQQKARRTELEREQASWPQQRRKLAASEQAARQAEAAYQQAETDLQKAKQRLAAKQLPEKQEAAGLGRDGYKGWVDTNYTPVEQEKLRLEGALHQAQETLRTKTGRLENRFRDLFDKIRQVRDERLKGCRQSLIAAINSPPPSAPPEE